MRLTRPGARPCHALGRSRLSSTELRGFVLSSSVDDECAGSELRSSQVLELVASAIRWIELHVKVMMVQRSARGRLVHRHHVGEGTVEKPVVLLQKAFEDSCKRFVILAVEVEQSGAMTHRCEMHLVRPARERRHERDPVLVAEHGAPASPLALEHVAVKAASGLAHVLGLGPQLSLQNRGNEWIRVDLTVWVAQSDADLLASVFEDVDVAHIGKSAQLASAIPPHLDEVANVLDTLLTERRVVVRRVADDLAASLLAREGREAVLEDGDVVVGLGNLGFGLPWPGWAQRAVVRRRVICAVLPPRGDGDPLFQ